MKLKHLGDSYDIVKKSLLQWLSAFGPWAAHPMLRHPTSPAEAEVLEELFEPEEHFSVLRVSRKAAKTATGLRRQGSDAAGDRGTWIVGPSGGDHGLRSTIHDL